MAEQRGQQGDFSQVAEAIRLLASDEDRFRALADAFRAEDADSFQRLLRESGLLERCEVVCEWLCSKECVLVCLDLCGPPPEELPDIRQFAEVLVRITTDEELIERLAGSIAERDAAAFTSLVEELQIGPFCHLLCRWACSVRCRLICDIVCSLPRLERRSFAEELSRGGQALRTLLAKEDLFSSAVEAGRTGDCEGLRVVVQEAGLLPFCEVFCEWICSWRCLLICMQFCGPFPFEKPDTSLTEAFEFARVTGRLAAEPQLLERLASTVEAGDATAFEAIVKELQLGQFCIQLCHWICFRFCQLFCVCVCPPLVGSIDTPAAAACAAAVLVSGCLSGSGGPLVGIEITGTAAGGAFDHYTLRYSWAVGPPVDAAVVYPDCSRPPAHPSSSVAVVGGTLGWLDVTLLPAGTTSFTVYLDVFDAASGRVSDAHTFDIQTTEAEIIAVAKVLALTAQDPFHPASTVKLVKTTNNVSTTVPEQSIGGSFSVDGSANLIGCDRIMSQFQLVRFDAPPATSVPTPPDATGGVPLLAAVPYEDTPHHPWRSGCFPVITNNTIERGDLVAFWSVEDCSFLGPYTVDKVEPTFWDSSALNGRFVIFLQVWDRPAAVHTFPGSFAAKDQVVVWIDNREPTALITRIGNVAGCGDLRLSDYKGTTAAVRGVAWDPPIDPTAPQQQPNDNFGSYSLLYKKNGEVPEFAIPGATTTRVPNVWPAPPAPGTDGLLADWDIVGDLDYTGLPPTPPGKLARGTRCAYVLSLTVQDTTHVGDSGINHTAGPFVYAST